MPRSEGNRSVADAAHPRRSGPGLGGEDTERRAEIVGLNQAQIHRCEKGAAELAMSALKRLALALGVTTDELVCEEDERGPDDELRLQFEAIARFDPDEKQTAKEVFDGLILKHEARRWASLRLTACGSTRSRAAPPISEAARKPRPHTQLL